uniref:DUF834 domain-containing protein n=1 Tax=Oryza barthii TaxID=65489 RepID=A0A0D3GH31_9ORYZ
MADEGGGDPMECDGGHGRLGRQRRRRPTRMATQWSSTVAMTYKASGDAAATNEGDDGNEASGGGTVTDEASGGR